MNYSLTKLNYIEFYNKLNEFKEKIKFSISEETLLNVKKELNTFIENNVYPNDEFLTDLLYYKKQFDFGIFRQSDEERFLDTKKNLEIKLNHLINYCSISENLKGNLTNISTILQKSDFILEKLNNLFDTGDYYSIEAIFKLNNIKFRDNENIEIAQDLKRRGYVTLINEYGNDDNSKISVKGANYIERKLKSQSEKKDNRKKTDLDKKIDIILDQLTKLGYGQQIIFEEIEEVRNLQTILPKKTWGQLLKGKLFDLALEEIISKETASEIFEFLTETSMKLLK